MMHLKERFAMTIVFVVAMFPVTCFSAPDGQSEIQDLSEAFGERKGDTKRDTQGSLIKRLTADATDVVLGAIVAVEYNEDVDPTRLLPETSNLKYKMRVVPLHVFHGDIAPVETGSRRENNMDEVGITVQYHASLRGFPGSGAPYGSTIVRPHPRFLCLLFLKHKKADLYELSDRYLGALPISPDLWKEKEKGGGKPWSLIVATLSDPDLPRYIHDRIFGYLAGKYSYGSKHELSKEKKKELREAHRKYYKSLLSSVKEELDNSRSDSAR